MKNLLLMSVIFVLAPVALAEQIQTLPKDDNEWISIPKHTFKPLNKDLRVEKSLNSGQTKNKSSRSAESAIAPNDEGYLQMYYWHPQNNTLQPHNPRYETNIGSSEINAAVNASVQNRKLRIAVIDGGFNDHDDIPWKAEEGHNFYQAFGQVINPQWRSLDDPNDCETGHGNAVGGIIGATANNGVGIAGILDAEIIPIRAFECNMARAIDIADAIRYAAGDKVKNAPVITKVDLINVSSEAFNGECHEPLQQAVDFAVNEGIQVYASAGNSNIEVSSKCDGVILIGGTNQQRTKWADSNYGSAIDFMIAGRDVYSYNFEGTTGWWDGTSFATPLAVSVHGLALQHDLEITHDEIVNLMTLTAQPMSTDIENVEEDCSDNRCGSGLINANRMMNYLIASSGDSPYILRHALASLSECDQTLYLSELGNSSRLCGLFELVIDESGNALEQNVQVVRVAKGSPLLDENAQLIITSKEPTILLDDINTEAYDYGVKLCETESCSNALIYPVDASTAQKPSQCLND